MRKGDEKRQEMLAVAERLFCTKGYEATSVQDILDVLHASKGGFYHHFASKEMVLDTLCTQRAERAGERTEDSLASLTDDMGAPELRALRHDSARPEEAPFLNMFFRCWKSRRVGRCASAIRRRSRPSFSPSWSGKWPLRRTTA